MNWKKFKSLPIKKKCSYIFCTVTWNIVLGSLLLFLFGSMIWQDYIQEPPLLQVEMINGNQKTADEPAFAPFLQENGLRADAKSVEVRKHMQLNGGENSVPINPLPMMILRIGSKSTDLYFWDTPIVQPLLAGSALTDLRTILPAETLEKYHDNLIYSAPMLQGGFPCGIYLRENAWVCENEYYDGCAVGIAENAENPELAVQFLSYILR